MHFQAAVLHEPATDVSVEDVEMSALRPSDVLVKVAASGLCHTDLEIILGRLNVPLPIVLGHEGAGVVEAVGEGVSRIKRGDHIVCSWNPSCGQCFYCVRDLPILCEVYARANAQGHLMDGSSRLRVGKRKLHHQSLVSSHAEYCVVPEAGAIPVSADIPLDRACLLGCGVMTGVGAVLRVARVAAGSSVVVFGCGAVGLNVIQGAALVRSEPLIAVDIEPDKLKKASLFGATHTVQADTEDAIERVRALTGNRGADYSFEAAGSERTLQYALEATRTGGGVVILGKVGLNDPVTFRFGSLVGEKRIIRSSYGGARPSRDFPLLAQWYLEGKLRLDELIDLRIPLAKISSGYAAMRNCGAIRTIIEFPY